MADYDLIVRNAKIVTAERQSEGDIAVKDGRVAALGADGAMTGFAWPEMLVQVYELFAAGKTEEAEDLFDIYLPLVRHEQQPAIGLALRKEVLFRRGAIKSPRQRAPGSSLTATDRGELDGLIQRLERRLAASGRPSRLAAE